MKQFFKTIFCKSFFCKLDSPLKMTLCNTIAGTNSERQVSDCFCITSKASWWPLWCEPKGTDHLCCLVQWWFVNQDNKKCNMASSKPLSNLRWNVDFFFSWSLRYSLHIIISSVLLTAELWVCIQISKKIIFSYLFYFTRTF